MKLAKQVTSTNLYLIWSVFTIFYLISYYLILDITRVWENLCCDRTCDGRIRPLSYTISVDNG